ncbi:serine--tRNA ligase [Candidatus Micrarchaeota archaeon]|nr:serine--tRNA ligase [Candidatus Micrarchaeota archaeon]
MLDIELIRNQKEKVKADMEKRGKEYAELVDLVAALDEKYRGLLEQVNRLRHQRNVVSKEINKLKKEGKENNQLISKARDLSNRIERMENELVSVKTELEANLQRLPNVILDDVPTGKDEADNVEIRRWGNPREDEVVNHVDWLVKKGYADFERAAKTSGARFYFLKDKLVKLQMALLMYSLDFITEKGFKPIYTPFLTKHEIESAATEISAFREVLYKVEDENLYLIPTTEHPILGYHYNEIVDEKELPLKYVGYSPAFRKEAGSHGKDTKGIFRVHQFMQTEMFVFSRPEDSEKIHEEMVRIQEELTRSLNIPYRVVKVCSGDLPLVAAKMYDIEAWFPAQKKYREITSCSNCLTYQSIPAKIRFLRKGDRIWVHTLNGTGLADTRTIVAIIENFQDEDGDVTIPKPLQKYTGFEVL